VITGQALESLQRLVLPDRWQAEAIQALNAGRDVILDAPTGAGKTYVFERWAEQLSFGRRALYTVPTRALANDKYAEWKERGWRVGITTGDVSIDPQAPVVVATLEAARGEVERFDGPAIADEATASTEPVRDAAEVKPVASPRGSFRLLVIDEYQWLSDPHRGNHYEGAVLALDPSVQLLLLSGSVANPDDVGAWLRRLGRTVEVVRTRDRPVPLEEVDVDDLIHGLPKTVTGYWARRLAGALREGLGPVLVFAPHRQDAERLARQFARELPLAEPLTLTTAQEQAAGPALAKLLRQRVAFHHSGLSYLQRAGLIEPLAKAGQLRAVVATLGLSAGINFSLRSVMVTAASYRFDQLERPIEPHELLQMVGRAGRRGLDDAGYVLVSSHAPSLRRAAPQRLKRAAPLPWAFLLRSLRPGESALALAQRSAHRFFTDAPLQLGAEMTALLPQDAVPCGHRTDTGRARLVRRHKRPFPACRTCTWRSQCLALSPQPTLLWSLQRVGVLDRALRLTLRGAIVASFLGAEGLALAAALEDRRYPLEHLLFDCANLFAGDRFAGTNPRRLGRLAAVCEKTYHRFSVEGFLVDGVPPHYGWGASEVVHAIVEKAARAGALAAASEQAGRGDIDRLMTEWRSLLRQVVHAPPLERTPAHVGTEEAAQSGRMSACELAERWEAFRELCCSTLREQKADALPELPPLTVEQRRPIQHRFLRGPAGAGRAAVVGR
jgi:superfamily II DNA/RNA helicase